ncbi:MAG: molybdopterin-guanine dinucleotide biosynthesis protein B [Lentisphaerae bacterium]|jgi:molybdenum cofactor guanylyltransferase|nr:molybdopterin-guanine dinucleotide biosynthesis protein B [Lentisphaerota bacterium]MBT4821728.1 molybdopterin-guanine dinucleotide biosynthesis protein B [Lentisphaerota bacterium]MBT5608828.1 molybdopterin-guanine dinucleotide biosynthesis protein B [Lentisphaerota bacterium]MBT7061512.1 molybdopterin-guanine dinucleotide biosynthesis protein B [Lentisphaerota bacterium]MBT7843359.1 molybdopterin-guanine dinucleotide biosynthesis protein B [Lentisphaerota bacterium]
MTLPQHIPVFAVCGWSGSGKTTVLIEVIQRLVRRGLTVGVVKQDVHGLNIDHEGKDTDRFYKAGADVLIRGPEQSFSRRHRTDYPPLVHLLKTICPRYDLILVEGHKTTPLPNKVWLLAEGEETCPPEATGIRHVLGRDEDRVGILLQMIDKWLPTLWRRAPLFAGILIGGEGLRMGQPKHVLRIKGRTYLEQIIDAVKPCVDQTVLLGEAHVPGSLSNVPRLPDAQGVRGPLAGMLAAMRWSPLTSWVFLGCDQPLVSPEALQWLLDTRKPGVWAVLPRLEHSSDKMEPLLAYYDFRAAPMLEGVCKPVDIADSPRVATPLVPASFTCAWTNVNTPADRAHAETVVAQRSSQQGTALRPPLEYAF